MTEAKNFNEGDAVTVSRGKHAGNAGKVVGAGAEEGTYGVKLDGGQFIVLKASALKAPAEKTITEKELQEIFTLADGSIDAAAAGLRDAGLNIWTTATEAIQ